MLLLYYINLIKLEKLWLSKNVRMSYISGRREYASVLVASCKMGSVLIHVEINWTASYQIHMKYFCSTQIHRTSPVTFPRAADTSDFSSDFSRRVHASCLHRVRSNCRHQIPMGSSPTFQSRSLLRGDAKRLLVLALYCRNLKYVVL